MADNVNLKIFQGLIIISLILCSGVAIDFQYDKKTTNLYRNGDVIAVSDFIVNAQRTWFALDSYYDEKVKCPKVEAMGGHRTATRCYYPDNYYERIKRNLIGTDISANEFTNKYTTTKTTPYYAYGTRGSKAGILYERMEFDKKTQREEDFPNSYNVMWTPKDTRNYQITWRLQKLDTSDYSDGTYYACNYVFGNVKIDLLDNCKDLNKVEIKDGTALIHFVNSRGMQDFDLEFVDPAVKEKEEPKKVSSLIDGWNIDVNSNYISDKLDYSVDVVSRDTFGKPTEIKVNWNWKPGEKATLLPATDKVSEVALETVIKARDEEYTVTHCSEEPPYGCILIPHMRYYLGKKFEKQDYNNIISMKQKGLPTNRKVFLDVEKDKGSFTTAITESTPVKIGFNTTTITLLYRNNDSYQPDNYVAINMSITDIDLKEMQFFFSDKYEGSYSPSNWDTLGQNVNRTGVSLSSYGPKTNKILWKKNVTGDFDEFAGLVVHDEYVYVSGKDYDAGDECQGHSELRKLNAYTGKEVCSIDIGGADSTPTYYNGVIYIGSWTTNKLFAINATNCEEIWNFTGNSIWAGAVAINEEENILYANTHSGCRLYALNISNGLEIWSNGFPFCSRMASSPLYYDGVVYESIKPISGYGGLFAYNSTNGNEIWAYDEAGTGGAWDSSFTLYENILYIGTYLSDYDFYAFYLNGTVKWKVNNLGSILSTPAINNGVLWFGGKQNIMYAYYTNGTQKCNYTTGGDIYSSPAIVDGVVYFGSKDHFVYAIDETDCSLIWSYETGNYIYGQPSVANGILYIASDDWYLYAFGIYNRTTFYDDSLVLMMNFENRTALGENSTHAVDLSSYQNNGTIHGATYTDSGKHGKGMSFDGVNDYVDCGNDSGLSFGVDDFTLEASVKLIFGRDYPCVFGKGDTGIGEWMLRFSTNTTLHFYGNSTSILSATNVLFLDTWRHIVFVREGDNAYIYIDGLLNSTIAGVAVHDFNTIKSLRIGNADGTNTRFFNGTIDSARIHNRALTADEINQSYMSNLDKYTADDWRFTTNQTSLNEGKYNFYAWVNDTAGVETTSTLYSYTYDAGSPYIQFELPTATNNTYTARNWTMINVTTTDAHAGTSLINWNNSLVGWWRMNKGTGTNLEDFSGYGNNGTAENMNTGIDNGSSGWTSGGRFGNGMMFDGNDDYVLINDNGITTSGYTMEMWFKPEDITGQKAMYYRHDKVKFVIESNVVRGGFYSSGWKTSQFSTSLTPIGSWYHILWTYDGTYTRVYLNGEEKDSDNQGIYTVISGSGRLGSWNNDAGKYFNGTIDEVKIHNRALSPEEINASYNAGLYRLYNNFTDLAEGEYTYTAYAQDLAGNVNQTETRTIVINDTCDCPGAAATWIPNMASLCNITSNCNLTTGSIHFDYSTTGAGNFTVSNCNFSALEYFMGYDFMLEGTGEWFVN